ncbi:MAG: 30S ribosomal protein S21, partial [Candidatus Komeilibacteria bacterium CG_4_9_14_3_um_filter_37_5]
MALEVKRKQGETFESLLRRFTKRTIQSGKLLQAKKIKYYQKPKTKRERKESALKREDFRKFREHLR